MNKFIEEHGLITIIRNIELVQIPNVVNALYDGGARVVEVAFNPSDPNTIEKTTAIIRRINEVMGDKLMVGAGTVISEEFLNAAFEAKAKFIT